MDKIERRDIEISDYFIHGDGDWVKHDDHLESRAADAAALAAKDARIAELDALLADSMTVAGKMAGDAVEAARREALEEAAKAVGGIVLEKWDDPLLLAQEAIRALIAAPKPEASEPSTGKEV